MSLRLPPAVRVTVALLGAVGLLLTGLLTTRAAHPVAGTVSSARPASHVPAELPSSLGERRSCDAGRLLSARRSVVHWARLPSPARERRNVRRDVRMGDRRLAVRRTRLGRRVPRMNDPPH